MEASFNRFISFDIQKGEHDAEDERHVYKNRHHDNYQDNEEDYIEDLSSYGAMLDFAKNPSTSRTDDDQLNSLAKNIQDSIAAGEGVVGGEGETEVGLVSKWL